MIQLTDEVFEAMVKEIQELKNYVEYLEKKLDASIEQTQDYNEKFTKDIDE